MFQSSAVSLCNFKNLKSVVFTLYFTINSICTAIDKIKIMHEVYIYIILTKFTW